MTIDLRLIFNESVLDIRYRITDFKFGGENMHYGEEDMCCSAHQGRHFLTKEEKIKKLKEYKNWLDNESKGVAETIAKLESN